jgi:hypothetical protein
MTHFNLFQKAIDEKNCIEAVRLAIQIGRGKTSKVEAWLWADEAFKVALKAGIMLNPGHESWPDFDDMERQLDQVKTK